MCRYTIAEDMKFVGILINIISPVKESVDVLFIVAKKEANRNYFLKFADIKG
jgi:hypothetical protein